MKKNRKTDDPEFAEAIRWVCEVTGIKYPVHLATQLGFPPVWGTRRSWGSRPEPKGLAIIFLASGGHEAFKPQDDREREAVEKLEKHQPKPLKEFLDQYRETLKAAHDKRRGKSDSTQEVASPQVSSEAKSHGFPVIPSPLADAIVAGMAEVKGQVLDANRFALTRDNFAHIGTSLTPAEIEDTVRLTNELTRRLRFLLQIDTNHRMKVLGSLGMSLNSLQAVLMGMKEITPDAMIRRINQALSGQEKKVDN